MAETMSVFFIFVSKAPDTEQAELCKYLLKLVNKYILPLVKLPI